MGFLVVRMKVLPKDAEIKPAEIGGSIREGLPEGMSIRDKSEEPIAFGLVALILDLLVEGRDGIMEDLKEVVHRSRRVGGVEVLGVSRAPIKLK